MYHYHVTWQLLSSDIWKGIQDLTLKIDELSSGIVEGLAKQSIVVGLHSFNPYNKLAGNQSTTKTKRFWVYCSKYENKTDLVLYIYNLELILARKMHSLKGFFYPLIQIDERGIVLVICFKTEKNSGKFSQVKCDVFVLSLSLPLSLSLLYVQISGFSLSRHFSRGLQSS